MKAELADALWHGRAKLARAEQGTDAEPGYSASVYLVDAIVGLLYALADRPLPAGSRRFDLVGSLDLPAHHMALFEQLCAGPARGRAARPSWGPSRATAGAATQRPRPRPPGAPGGLAT